MKSKHKKGKVVPVHTMQACNESGGTAAFIPNLSSRWRWVVHFVLFKKFTL